jgi:pimeloyl-ACP methyl ester carboxylesterase
VAGKDSLLLDGMSDLVRETLAALGISRAILVGHGTASLIALALAREPGNTEIVGAAVIAGTGVAPTGDGLPNTTLAYPPTPAWSPQAQRWALERLSFTPHHITQELIDKLVEASAGEPHAQAAALFADPEVALEVEADRLSGKLAFLAYCRDHGYALPITIVWGADDPLAAVPYGDGLFEVLSTTTAPLDFTLINRAGHLPHRERPAEVAYQLERLHALL